MATGCGILSKRASSLSLVFSLAYLIHLSPLIGWAKSTDILLWFLINGYVHQGIHFKTNGLVLVTLRNDCGDQTPNQLVAILYLYHQKLCGGVRRSTGKATKAGEREREREREIVNLSKTPQINIRTKSINFQYF